ncbi:MAG: NADH-quinone oxidoreductase subunit NuoE [Clostridiales bacterium]|jgi:NADH:ubiquinone oxidoreductase subunit E|nr:NADH-quinone oxidoreductase subunit NuoE [Clostridiales bacterium]
MIIDLTNKTIETPRLLLRAWRITDIDDFFEYASVEGVGEAAGWKHYTSKTAAEERLRIFIAQKDVFAIIYKENNKVIGSFGILERIVKDSSVKELGYVISKDYWGRGLATEATKAVIDFCFNDLNLYAVTCAHFAENIRSKRVIEKCGFSFACKKTHYAEQLDKDFEACFYVRFKESLIAVLQNIQEKFGYLPKKELADISEQTHIPIAKILGVATFYAQFRLEPVGKHLIVLCQGTACHVNGAEEIAAAIKEELEIQDGCTTKDGLFTFTTAACLGCCSLSPVMTVDGETFGALTPAKAKTIINDFRRKEGTE